MLFAVAVFFPLSRQADRPGRGKPLFIGAVVLLLVAEIALAAGHASLAVLLARNLADSGHWFRPGLSKIGARDYTAPPAVRQPASDPASFGQRNMPGRADNDMIEQANIDQRQGACKPFGDASIGLAWLAVSGRMVVAQDQRRGIVVQGTFQHFARVDRGAVERATEQRFETDQPVSRVQKQAAKNFIGQFGQP
jgi:hypothetical protein